MVGDQQRDDRRSGLFEQAQSERRRIIREGRTNVSVAPCYSDEADGPSVISEAQRGNLVEEFFEPTYILDFRDEKTRKRIRSAKPGDVVKVKLRLVDNSAAATLEAMGTRSKDGKQFEVRLTIGERFQDIHHNYEDVLVLADNRGKC